MNKDRLVAKFDIVSFEIEVFGKLLYGCSINRLREWIDSRLQFTCVLDADKFFVEIGVVTLRSKIENFHCVSLNDTFWVKYCNSNLRWKDVSPFRNDYSKTVAIYGLEGVLRGREKSYYSPIIGTDGSFPHAWNFYGVNNITFIKAGSKYTLGGVNSGNEPISEYYASCICEFLEIEHVRYNIIRYIRQDGSEDFVNECQCFTSEEHGSVSAAELGLFSYEDILRFSKNLSWYSYKKVLDMLFLDCLLLNTDRHFGNIRFIMNNETLEVIGVAPVFDNNCALLTRFIEGVDTFNRQDYRASDGRSFDELYAIVSSHFDYEPLLLKLKDFRFKKLLVADISGKRLEFLNWFLQMQVDYLLESK